MPPSAITDSHGLRLVIPPPAWAPLETVSVATRSGWRAAKASTAVPPTDSPTRCTGPSAVPAITALAHIRSELGPDYPLLFDSGVRSGEDIVKALAVGANFVMLGRAALYAIGAGGADGLRALFDSFEHEIILTLAQIGLAGVSEISPEALADHPSNLPSSA